MNTFYFVILLLLFPVLLFIAYLALSSCLGDTYRARISGTTIIPRVPFFGRSYGRGIGSQGPGGWEQIEMEEMLGDDHSEGSDLDVVSPR